MWFGSSIQDARLEGTVLVAKCRTSAGDWQLSILDLDHYLGNENGLFDWESENFSATARNIRLEDTTLSARLQTRQNAWVQASLNLNHYLTSEDGHLVMTESHHSGFMQSCRNAFMEGGVLHAECLTLSGEVRKSFIDLNECIGNCDGELRWDSENFSATAQDVRLEGTILHARLATLTGEWRSTSTDLQDRIKNLEGTLLRNSSSFEATKTQHLDSNIDTPTWWTLPQFIKDETRIQRDRDEVIAQKDRRLALDKSLMSHEHYKYNPLRKEKNLRLLKLEPPGQSSDVIACSLVEVELASAEKFVALSYTWGSPFPPSIDSVEHGYKQGVTILCNGNRMLIKQNLYDAMYRLREGTKVTKSQPHTSGLDLIASVESGSSPKVEDMLRRGADVEMRDSSGRTALHLAAKMGHLDMTKALVMAGSDINALCRLRKRPLDYAKEGRGRYVKSVANLLDAEHKSEHVRHRVNTSLRLRVTECEYFWIDAICINQADEIEKAAQVSIMGEIYRASCCVSVWLGREFHDYQDSTELLLGGVWRLEQAREGEPLSADILEKLIDDPVATFRQIGTSRMKRAATEWLNTLGLDTIKPWYHLPHLFHRTWFDRAWILQEVLMARDLTIVCGQYIVPWDMFLLMSSIIECCRSLLGTNEIYEIFASKLWDVWLGSSTWGAASMLRKGPPQSHISPLYLAQWRIECQKKGRLSMVSALSLSRNQKATDARDKVFCVLAFSPIERQDNDKRQSIKPDYSLSTARLYIEVAKSLLAAYGPCILSLSGLSSHSTTTGLPTWVPDLNSQLTSRLRGINVQQRHRTAVIASSIETFACQSPSPVYITSQDELVIKCYLWDVVAEVAHSGLNEIGRNLKGLVRWLGLLEKLNGTPEQRRQTLLCCLAERPLGECFNGSHFEDWLKLLCFTSIVGQRRALQELESFNPIELLDEDQESGGTLLSRAQELLAVLGYTLSSEEIKNWSGEGRWRPHVTQQYSQGYRNMIRDAMQYGAMLRNNDITRRLLRTALTNLLGTGPEETQPGDIIVLVEGVNTPYLLRRVQDEQFELIGEIYIHDLDIDEVLRETERRATMRTLYIV